MQVTQARAVGMWPRRAEWATLPASRRAQRAIARCGDWRDRLLRGSTQDDGLEGPEAHLGKSTCRCVRAHNLSSWALGVAAKAGVQRADSALRTAMAVLRGTGVAPEPCGRPACSGSEQKAFWALLRRRAVGVQISKCFSNFGLNLLLLFV